MNFHRNYMFCPGVSVLRRFYNWIKEVGGSNHASQGTVSNQIHVTSRGGVNLVDSLWAKQ